MKRSPLAALVLSPLLGACAPSLLPPPTVAELAGETTRGPSDADMLLERAEREFAERTVESVRSASRSWLEAGAADPARSEAWTGASRAGVWLAGHEADPATREEAARSAVRAAQVCATHAPDEAACRYWLAVALGVQARERRATALDALPRMVRLLEDVAATDPGLDHAGPDRVLALVLVRAPGWPTGPGDPDRALEHARRAVRGDPGHPPNHLCLAEALAAVGKESDSREALARAGELARARLAEGDPDAPEWLERIREAEAWNRAGE